MRLGSPASKSRLRVRLAPFDLLWAFVAPVLALALRDLGLLDPGDFPISIRPAYEFSLVTTAIAIPTFIMFRISEGMSRFVSVRDVLSVCAAVAVAVASSSVVLFVFTRLEGVPRSTPLICGLVMAGGLMLSRMIARVAPGDTWGGESWGAAATPLATTHDAFRRRVILIGVDRFAAIAIKLIENQRPRSTLIAAALDPRPDYTDRKIGGVKIVGDIPDFDSVVEEYAVHGIDINEVWIGDDASLHPLRRAQLEAACIRRNLPLLDLSEALNLTPAPGEGAAATTFFDRPPNDYFKMKRFIDVLAASTMLVVLLPVLLIVACLTLVDVGGPVLFWQQRVGMNGRRFLLYKFRTLQAPFDNLGARVPEDLRLSGIGRLLRGTRLDELPQLMNVLVGDMSIIGPRPLLPHDQPADPSTRLMVRPGITGWAQINGGTIVTTDEKDALDAWYVRHASLALDLRILALTLRFVVTGEKLNASALQEAIRFRAAAPAEVRPFELAPANANAAKRAYALGETPSRRRASK